MNWVTEITQAVPGSHFIDEQRFGPYRFWHHLHRFTEKDGGVLDGGRIALCITRWICHWGAFWSARFTRKVRAFLATVKSILNEIFPATEKQKGTVRSRRLSLAEYALAAQAAIKSLAWLWLQTQARRCSLKRPQINL
jgi:hypothetical protein